MIRFQAFSKSFGTVRAVDSLTLSVGAGEVVALLGPNGSGKTTCLKAAAGLVHPTSGEVFVGEPGLPAALPAARKILSFLPQKVAFPEALTGREVVEFYRGLRGGVRGASDAALRLAALNGASRRAVGTYSGGMVQRLGLAVAALPGAPILLLDEPTSSLDAEGLAAVHALVERCRGDGRTVLFTSHQLADVERLADRIAVMVEGKLVARMSREELTERLAARGVMRVRLGSCPSALLDRIAAVAPGAAWSGDQLVVPGSARARAAAIDVVRAAGVEIQGLSAEEGRLDLLYRELTGGATCPN